MRSGASSACHIVTRPNAAERPNIVNQNSGRYRFVSEEDLERLE